MGVSWPDRGLPGSPQDPGHEKSMGKKLVTVPGPDSAVLGGRSSKNPSKIFRKCEKNPGSGTGREIDLENVSGALREHAATEKHGEEAGAGQGARFPCFWT